MLMRYLRILDIIAIVASDKINLMDEVIDRIAELEDVAATDTKVARWLGWKGNTWVAI